MIITNFYVFIPLLSALINLFLIALVVTRLKKDRRTATYLLYICDITIIQIFDTYLWGKSPSDTIELLFRINHIFIFIGPFFFMNFLYAILRKKPNWFYYFVLISSIVSSFLAVFSDTFMMGIREARWGLEPEPGPLNLPILLFVIVIPLLYFIVIMWYHMARSEDAFIRKQTRIVFIGSLLAMLFLIIINIVIPHLFPSLGFPQIGVPCLVIQTLVTAISVTKYRFLSVEVEQVAHDIFSQINEGIILTDRDGLISHANDSTCTILSYDFKHLKGKFVGDILPKSYRFTENFRENEIKYVKEEITRYISLSQTSLYQTEIYVGKLIIIKDITERKQALIDKDQAQKQLLESAHQSGMAEIASNVLHEFGNILTSINVSAEIISQTIQKSKVYSFEKSIEIINQHKDDLSTFIKEDPRGKLLPAYLDKVSGALTKEHDELQEEVQTLILYLSQMKTTVDLQRRHTQFESRVEKVNLADTLEYVLTLHQEKIKNREILLKINNQIDRDFKLVMQQSKLMYVLSNVLINSIESFGPEQEYKEINIEFTARDENTIELKFSDNGEGIEEENIDEIFSYGYTTKPEHIGVGLHMSSIYVKQMNGEIHVESPGKNEGTNLNIIFSLNDDRSP